MFRGITLKTNIKVSNNKTKPRIKEPIVRLLLLTNYYLPLSLKYVKWENLNWTEKFLLPKISTDPQYCERLTSISKRQWFVTLLSSY